jgi:hypothetical protein
MAPASCASMAALMALRLALISSQMMIMGCSGFGVQYISLVSSIAHQLMSLSGIMFRSLRVAFGPMSPKQSRCLILNVTWGIHMMVYLSYEIINVK